MSMRDASPAARRDWARTLSIECLEERCLLSGRHAHLVSRKASPPDATTVAPIRAAASDSNLATAATTGQRVASTAAAEQRLPDLTVWASSKDRYLYGWSVDSDEVLMPGRKLLRLTTAIANHGLGPLELRPGAVNAEGNQEVLQRIYDSNGEFMDRTAGTFVFHPQHAHMHFEDFAQYNLRGVAPDDGVGDVVASGAKVSFCLLDGVKADGSVNGSPRTPQYQSCSVFQGISAGWADVYDSSLPDQWIDITDVPPGRYWLESIADPSDRIVESDETNNVTRIMIEYMPPPSDDFADTFESATPLALSNNGAGLQTGQIGVSGDVDVFTITVSRKAKLKITQSSAGGDIDCLLAIYDSAGQLISEDDDGAAGQNSRIKVRLAAGQNYFVKAAGFGDTTGQYVLTFTVKYR